MSVQKWLLWQIMWSMCNRVPWLPSMLSLWLWHGWYRATILQHNTGSVWLWRQWGLCVQGTVWGSKPRSTKCFKHRHLESASEKKKSNFPLKKPCLSQTPICIRIFWSNVSLVKQQISAMFLICLLIRHMSVSCTFYSICVFSGGCVGPSMWRVCLWLVWFIHWESRWLLPVFLFWTEPRLRGARRPHSSTCG